MSRQNVCPDGGACHHDCAGSCWRVSTCEPLSVSGWDSWPDAVVVANPHDGRARIEDVLLVPSIRSVGADGQLTRRGRFA